MSSTFQRVKDEADMLRLKERWELTEEYLRKSVAAPVPFNIPVCMHTRREAGGGRDVVRKGVV